MAESKQHHRPPADTENLIIIIIITWQARQCEAAAAFINGQHFLIPLSAAVDAVCSRISSASVTVFGLLLLRVH